MKKLTSKKVKEYVEWRSDKKIKHCPEALATACNEGCYEFNHNKAIDLLKLICFDDCVPSLMTHNYGFHTATGRYIINTLQEKYYEYK
jgi:hypothetical protein